MGESTSKIKVFEDKHVRREWDADDPKWRFSVNETVTNCHGLKILVPYGKMCLKEEKNETVTNCHRLKI